MKNDLWKDKISNHHQLGGIELSVLDNGDGSGCRIAWFNTGSGLRPKVVIDRAMDIVDALLHLSDKLLQKKKIFSFKLSHRKPGCMNLK